MAITDKPNIINETADEVVYETDSLIVSEIIKKYNLKDIDEDAIEKLGKNEPFIIPGAVINGCAKKLAALDISDKDAELLLTKSFSLKNAQVADLLKDIKEKIVPKIQRSLKQKTTKETQISQITKETSEVFPKEMFPKAEPQPTVVQPKKIKKTLPIVKEPISQTKQSKGPDTYRESIE